MRYLLLKRCYTQGKCTYWRNSCFSFLRTESDSLCDLGASSVLVRGIKAWITLAVVLFHQLIFPENWCFWLKSGSIAKMAISNFLLVNNFQFLLHIKTEVTLIYLFMGSVKPVRLFSLRFAVSEEKQWKNQQHAFAAYLEFLHNLKKMLTQWYSPVWLKQIRWGIQYGIWLILLYLLPVFEELR